MRRKIGTAVVGLGVAGAFALGTGSASSHGYISTPPSRQALCAAGTVTDCGGIQYEPQSVEGPKGFPSAGPADGTICSGGNSRFAQLDDPRGGAWPATSVSGGQSYTFTWKLTAQHSTTDFSYYLTKNGYDPTKPLTRSEINTTPLPEGPLQRRPAAGDRGPPGHHPHRPHRQAADRRRVDDRRHGQRLLRLRGRPVLTFGSHLSALTLWGPVRAGAGTGPHGCPPSHGKSGMRARRAAARSAEDTAEEAADVAGDGVELAFQGEVARVEEVDLGLRQVARKARAPSGPKISSPAPQTASSGTWLVAEVLLQGRVEVDVGR